MFEQAGHTHVVTLLNSGNVVFSAAGDPDPEALRAGILAETGVSCELMLVRGAAFRAVSAANPVRSDDRPGNRIAVSFPGRPVEPGLSRPPAEELAPEELVVTADAVYQWLPGGMLSTTVPAAWWRSLGTPVTTRNDATVLKLVAALESRNLL